MSFWHVIELFFWSFVMIAYLMVLFTIVADLFRDRELGGGWKALWMILLVFIPFLTSIVYLIVRGRGMGERNQRQAQQAKDQAETYIREVAATATPSDEITKAKALLDSGAITSDEFEKLKTSALSKNA